MDCSSSLYVVLILATLAGGAVALSRHVSASWGPWLLALAAVALLRRPLLRLLGAARASLSWGRVLRAGVAAVIVGALAFVPWPLRVEGPALVDSRLRAAVRPEFAGTLAEVLVREGESVAAGAPVARLDPSELRSELEMVRSEIDRARSRHALLMRGPRKEEVIQAREAVKAAEAELAHRRSRQARLERLRSEGLVATDFFEQAAKELAIAEISLRTAREQLRLVEKGARPEEVEAAAAEVQRLEAKAEEIQRRIEACTLRAPMAGLVLSAALDTRIGERIPAGGTVLEIGDDRSLVADVEVPESEIGDIAVGQKVRLALAAFPDHAFAGTVQSIAAVAGRDVHGRATFQVRCSVDDPQGLLRPGMTGAAHIDGGLRTIGTLVSRRVRRLIHPSLL
ncbi:MAG: efflux RND transporter periplasmic adaptor subunit [Acidobacteriota bacterium]|nr:efflux RND transporter periplasmic adaptor subunit [Acidobacteriota bacterium]